MSWDELSVVVVLIAGRKVAVDELCENVSGGRAGSVSGVSASMPPRWGVRKLTAEESAGVLLALPRSMEPPAKGVAALSAPALALSCAPLFLLTVSAFDCA